MKSKGERCKVVVKKKEDLEIYKERKRELEHDNGKESDRVEENG